MPYDLTKITVTNGEGWVKTREQAEALLDSAVTRITWGSEKIEPWHGNIGETYYFNPETRTAWNSKGLPCRGFKYAREVFAELRHKAHSKSKQLAVSIAESTPENSGILAQELAPFVDIIIFNGGCGNVWGKDGQKPIPSYHPELLKRSLGTIDSKVRGRCLVSLKISPIGDELFEPLAEVINQSCVDEVIGVNTKINQSAKRLDGSQALAFAEKEGAPIKHVGGMSGASLREDALRVQAGLRPMLKRHIKWIYCGGIFTGADAHTPLERGADGFAIGTALFEHGPRIFSDVFEGLVQMS